MTYLETPYVHSGVGTQQFNHAELNNLDQETNYYMRFMLDQNSRSGSIEIQTNPKYNGVNTQQGYFLGTYGSYNQLPNKYYTNKGTQFRVGWKGDILQAILNVSNNLFIVWPQNISFEDFYHHHLLGKEKGTY